jgi:hypothetical protein
MRKLLLDSSANYTERSTITSMTNTDVNVGAEITKRYREAIEHNRSRINCTLRPLYGKDIPFKESILTDVIISIKRIIDVTGMNIDELANYFKSKGITNFFCNGKPVSSEKIIKGFHALQSGLSLQTVRNILYK